MVVSSHEPPELLWMLASESDARYHCRFSSWWTDGGNRVAVDGNTAVILCERESPGAIAQDGFLTTHLIESLMIPERELIEEYLGRPDDIIDTPTAAQRIIYGETRRRIPELWDVDNSVMVGLVQNQDSYMQSVAAQRPFFFDHIKELTSQAFDDLCPTHLGWAVVDF